MRIETAAATLIVMMTGALPVAPSAQAQRSLTELQVADGLATMFASEAPCGLKYNQAAIRAFVADKVPAADMGFAELLGVNTRIAERRFTSMSESEKTAHCERIESVARANRFIE